MLKKIAPYIQIICLSLGMIFTLIGTDQVWNGGSVSSNIMTKPNCDYIVPTPYVLTYDSTNKKYFILHPGAFGKEYDEVLRGEGLFDFKLGFADIYKPALFKDSCKAKGALYKYLSIYN